MTSGFDSCPRFAENITLHRETPLLNYVGSLTIASYDAANSPPADLSNREKARWKDGRQAALRERSWMVLASWLVYVVLLVRAAARSPDWVVAALGIGAVFVFLEITAYYYSMLIAFALLHERDSVAGPAICAFAAISLLLSSYGVDSGSAFVHLGISASLAPIVLVSTWRAGNLPPDRAVLTKG